MNSPANNNRFENWRQVLLAENPEQHHSATIVREKEKDHNDVVESSLLGLQGAVFLAKLGDGKMTWLHHLSKVETTKDNKTTNYVALAGLDSEAMPLELDDGFPKMLQVKAPAWECLLDGTVGPASQTFTIRPIQPVPPCLQPPLLHSADQSPAALLAKAREILREERDGTEDPLCQSLVAYLWHEVNNERDSKLLLQDVKPSSSKEATEWSKKLHQENIVSCKSFAPRTGGDAKKQRTWDASLDRLKAYRQIHGDCNVPREFKSDPALGEWVKCQRSIARTLSKERRAALESIGFTFSNTQRDRSNKIWDSYFEKLQDYWKKHGDCRPIKTDTKEHRALQHWVSAQRQSFKRGTLSEDKKARLEAINFVWKVKSKYKPREPKDDKAWNRGYEKLVEFHKVHSHVNVPKRPKSARPLWEWVYAQKKAYNEQRLPEDKVALLEKLGMVWERDNAQALRDQQWDAKFNEAKAFRELHGHLEVPRSGTYGNTTLLKWLSRQRSAFANEKLAAGRIAALTKLGFVFEETSKEKRDKLLQNLAWKESYGELIAYREKNGTVCIPQNASVSDKRMEKWIAKQTVADQFDDLDPTRKQLLMELGVEFAPKTEGRDKKPQLARKKPNTGEAEGMATSKEKENIQRQAATLPVNEVQLSGEGDVDRADKGEGGMTDEEFVASTKVKKVAAKEQPETEDMTGRKRRLPDSKSEATKDKKKKNAGASVTNIVTTY